MQSQQYPAKFYVAVFLGCMLAGAGHFVYGHPLRGLAWMAGYVFLLLVAVVVIFATLGVGLPFGGIFVIGFWLLSLYDLYVVTH